MKNDAPICVAHTIQGESMVKWNSNTRICILKSTQCINSFVCETRYLQVMKIIHTYDRGQLDYCVENRVYSQHGNISSDLCTVYNRVGWISFSTLRHAQLLPFNFPTLNLWHMDSTSFEVFDIPN